MNLNTRMMKCFSLLCLGAGLATGCGGAPEEAPATPEAARASGTVSAQLYTMHVNLTCSPNYPFEGLVITNTSLYDLPVGAIVSYVAYFNSTYSIGGTTTLTSPLARGQHLTVWVDPIYIGRALTEPQTCSSTAKWDPYDV